MAVRKAVILAAGFGTRFLPASRSVSKVMLPVLDTPAVHFIVEEAAQAGIDHIVFVVSKHVEGIRGYFDRIPELERALEERGEDALLEKMLAISEMAEISYVHQHMPLGPGHAVLAARTAVGREPFAVFLPDDIIWSDSPTIGRMTGLFDELGGSVIAVKEVTEAQIPSLGIIDPRPIADRLYEVEGLVEKPRVGEAPSNLAIIGRYVLTPNVFDMIERTAPGAGGEIQLTDAIAMLMPGEKVYAYRFPGVHIDVGTPLGLLKASLHAAMQRADLAEDLKRWLGEAE